jgi:hypothetical protein
VPCPLIPALSLLACALISRANHDAHGSSAGVFLESKQKEVKHVPVKPTSAAPGKQMYDMYCAMYRGKNGKGRGPAAEALKATPTDLTVGSRKEGGKFPSAHVASAIRGDITICVHGTKDMPVWGNLFWHMS